MKVAVDKDKRRITLVPRRQENLLMPRSEVSWPWLCWWHSSLWRNWCWNCKDNWSHPCNRKETWSQDVYKKTEIMSIGQASGSNPIVPLGNEGLIKVVDHSKYLGAVCSANGTNIKELNSRTGKAAAAFRELDKVWRDRNINLDIKM